MVLFGGLIGVLRWLAYWEKTSADRPNPKRLFADLCDTHGLSHEERAVLRELAAAKGLPRPAELFVRPELFSEGPRAVSRLRDRLFGPGSA